MDRDSKQMYINLAHKLDDLIEQEKNLEKLL